MMERAKEPVVTEISTTGEFDAPYHDVFGDVSKIIDAARESAARSVNSAMTAAYWLIGRRVVEFEQLGGDRAEYGAALIERLAADLTAGFGRGFSRQNLYYMRQFYLSYPPDRILQTLSGTLAPSLRAPDSPDGVWKIQLLIRRGRLRRPYHGLSPCPGPPTCACCR